MLWQSLVLKLCIKAAGDGASHRKDASGLLEVLAVFGSEAGMNSTTP